MASIKPIEGRSIHQITSGQVIVDLNSVVKELVENALDAGATSIDVRFKNNGLDSIEVQDNGSGIAPDDYETIALKHYTSKLASYDDLTSLTTFGFRGEALSSLCALSRFHILTAQAGEAPKGKRLDFEVSGKLKGTAIAACQKGTTVAVEELFHNLPVRRKELEKNIKREYSKVLGLLHAYACVSTNVRISVSNQMPKGKKVFAFSTKSNGTTKENIANVFGAKTLPAIIPLDLDLELQPTTSQVLRDIHGENGDDSRAVKIIGHISKPVFGEGRQTPDRQMFFVNSRPCGLPQISKAFNEVYKSFNVTQSPFIFADLRMNTNAYDVNVSPDKRTILLHDQTALLESIKDALTRMFEAQEQTVPQSQLQMKKLPAFRPLSVTRHTPASDNEESPLPKRIAGLQYDRSSPVQEEKVVESSASSESQTQDNNPQDLVSKFVGRDLEERADVERERLQEVKRAANKAMRDQEPTKDKQKLVQKLAQKLDPAPKTAGEEANSAEEDENPAAETAEEEADLIDELQNDEDGDESPSDNEGSLMINAPQIAPQIIADFNARLASQAAKRAEDGRKKQDDLEEPPISQTATTPRRQSPGVVQNAFNRMRPQRTPQETATITIGSKTSTVDLGTPPSRKKRWVEIPTERRPPSSQFARFAAPGTQLTSLTSQSSSQAQSDHDQSDQGEGMDEDVEAATEALVVDDDPDVADARQAQADDASDDDFIDENEKKQREEERVQELIRQAEEDAAQPTQANLKRAANLLRSSQSKDSTLTLLQFLETKVSDIEQKVQKLNDEMADFARVQHAATVKAVNPDDEASEEERLSLTISKSDFSTMRIIGQFNLGFILAVREGCPNGNGHASLNDDLFIIDQHASDEIYNFHRLSASTTLTPQPLVRPHLLELTAIEEETIMIHSDTLTKNGFTISVDETGASPVGSRCALLTLPTSRETTFSPRDLEELIALLTETTPKQGEVLRPSKVRKMLAMRACRSSIMVGKTLTKRGMAGVVQHMGEIEKPWNCPHGRPTMRHLAGLGDWSAWTEGCGLAEEEDEGIHPETDWQGYLKRVKGKGDAVKVEDDYDTIDDVDMDG